MALLNKIDIFNEFNYEKGVCSSEFSFLIVLTLTINIQLFVKSLCLFNLILPNFVQEESIKMVFFEKIEILNELNFKKGVCSSEFLVLIVLALMYNNLVFY